MKLNEAAKGFISGTPFVNNPFGTSLQRKLVDLRKRLDAATTNGSLSLKSVNDSVNDSFGTTAQKVVDSDDFKKVLSNLQDSVNFAPRKYLQCVPRWILAEIFRDQSSLPLESIAKQLRDAQLFQKVAEENKQAASVVDPKQSQPAVNTSGILPSLLIASLVSYKWVPSGTAARFQASTRLLTYRLRMSLPRELNGLAARYRKVRLGRLGFRRSW